MSRPAPQNTSSGSLWAGIRNLLLAVTVVAAAGASLWYFVIRDDFQAAQPGDCLDVPVAMAIVKEVHIVDCASPQAKSTVLGVIRGRGWYEISNGAWETLCQPWQATQGAILQAKRGADTGDVLCLKPMHD